jgi:hypothetical protein
LYRGINEFKKGYQPRINIIKNENGNLLADPQSVLNRWINFFNQVLNVRGVHNVRQMDIHTAEPLVPEPSPVEVKIAIGKLKSYKSPDTDQIPGEFIKAGGETLCSEIHRLICSIWNNEELPQQWKDSIIISTYKKGDKTGWNLPLINCLQNFIQHSSDQVNFMWWEDNSKLDLRDIGIDVENWIHPAQDRVQWPAFLTISFSNNVLHHGVSKCYIHQTGIAQLE